MQAVVTTLLVIVSLSLIAHCPSSIWSKCGTCRSYFGWCRAINGETKSARNWCGVKQNNGCTSCIILRVNDSCFDCL